MGLLDKLFGGGKEEEARPERPAPSSGSRRAAAAAKPGEEPKSCKECGRRLLPGVPCPFCHPQHFGDELPGGTLDQEHRPQQGVAAMGGIVVANHLAREHGARGFLHVYQGANKGASVLLATRPVSIGRRADKNVLPLNDGGVSTRHCEIRPTQKGFRVVDVGSKNGTFVNDERVKEKELQDGDLLAFGGTRIYVGVLRA